MPFKVPNPEPLYDHQCILEIDQYITSAVLWKPDRHAFLRIIYHTTLEVCKHATIFVIQ